jgi:hypothetical protein
MEPAPDMETVETEFPAGEETPETDSEVSSASASPMSTEDFNRRVEKLMEMMETDSKVRDRLLAEMYVNFASAEQGIRGMVEAFQSQGFAGMMRGAFRKG